MRNRFVLRLTATLAGIALTATLAAAAPAADECLAKPKGAAPAGKHWYYSTDRKIQRKCWYLDDANGKTVTAAPHKTSVAATAPPAPQSVESPQNVDARAELVEEPKVEQTPAPAAVAPAVPEPQPVPSQETSDPGKANGWQVASRWPEPSDNFVSTPAPTISETVPAAQIEKAPVVVADTAPPAPAPAAAPEGYSDVDVGLIAAALILLVVVGGTLVMLTRRRSAAQAQAMRRARRRDEMPWRQPAVARTAPMLRDRSEVVDEIEQLLAAGRQPSPSN